MIIKTTAELQAMQEIGGICATVLKKMGEALEPGLTTLELDQLAGALFAAEGAKSAPIACYDFPGQTCISVNEVVAHGIPSALVIKSGDIVNIDISAVKNGFFGDTSASFAVPPIKTATSKLLDCTKQALEQAIGAAVAGYPMNGLGLAVEKTAHRHGFKTIRNLCGHGVGHTLHDEPECIYNYYEKRDKRMLTPGLVLAIEPFISERDLYVEDANDDGWTLVTAHRCQVAQFEHTVMVREDQPPLILTALPK
ncbi:MAG: type I methionyl aminopeptidase [Clostridiales bacterium]